MSIQQQTPGNSLADEKRASPDIKQLVLFALVFAVVFGPVLSMVSSFVTAGILGHISVGSTLGYFVTLGKGAGLSMAMIFTVTFALLSMLRYLSLANQWSLRLVGTLLAFLLIVLQITHHAMYYEFGAGINRKILHLFQGDALTILNFLNAQYPMWAFVLGAITLAFLGTLAIEKLMDAIPSRPAKSSIAWSLGILPLWAFYGIYSFNVGENLRLNNFPKLGDDAYLSSVKTAIITKKDYHRGFKQYLTGLTTDNSATLETAAAWVNGERDTERPSQVFSREFPPPPFKLLRKPSHLFFLQLESHDGLVLHNEALRVLSPNLNRFKDTGIYVPHFFEGSGSTNSSIMSIATGYPGLRNIPKTSKLKQLNVLNLVDYLKAQGYRCSSHSAAKYDACRHGMFLDYLGFDHTSYSDNYEESEWADTWGISDDTFAADFLKAVDTDEFSKAPQFVFWKNHSNHSPYSVDVFGMGFDPSVVSEEHLGFFKKAGYDPAKVAGHYWFADKQVGRVVDELQRRHPDSLFIIMADHHSRYSRDPSDPLSQVRLRFILWGPNVIPGEASGEKTDWYGTHMDVFPSLLSLLSPEQKQYSLYGSPLWDTGKYIYTTYSTGDAQVMLLKEQMRFYDFRNNTFANGNRAVTPFLRRSAGIRALTHQVLYSADSWDSD